MSRGANYKRVKAKTTKANSGRRTAKPRVYMVRYGSPNQMDHVDPRLSNESAHDSEAKAKQAAHKVLDAWLPHAHMFEHAMVVRIENAKADIEAVPVLLTSERRVVEAPLTEGLTIRFEFWKRKES